MRPSHSVVNVSNDVNTGRGVSHRQHKGRGVVVAKEQTIKLTKAAVKGGNTGGGVGHWQVNRRGGSRRQLDRKGWGESKKPGESTSEFEATGGENDDPPCQKETVRTKNDRIGRSVICAKSAKFIHGAGS